MRGRSASITLTLLATPILLLGLTTATANADTIYVPGDYPTIQEAIYAAHDGDIIIVADGTYSGPLNRNLDFGGLAITLRSDNGPEYCIIDCLDMGRGFQFRFGEGPDSVVEGFTVTGGSTFYLPRNVGGAIYCYNASSPIIRDCVITDCTAYSGGGIACEGGSNSQLISCTLSGNSATFSGGAVNCEDSGTLVIRDSTIESNTATYGGAIYCWNTNVLLSNTAVVANTVDYSGAIYGHNVNLSLVNCVIAENSGAAHGGGVCCTASSELSLVNCTIVGHHVTGVGGGIYCDDTSSTIVNCTISDNTADDHGGGICFNGGTARLQNCILWDNDATYGPELALQQDSSVLVCYSVVAGGWGVVYISPGSTLDWGEGNILDDPLFLYEYHLSSASPCIDAGCNGGIPPDIADLDGDGDTAEITPVDLDGESRFFDDPNTPDSGCGCSPIVDMGAYEFGDTGPQPCPGDLDCDRVVGQPDLGILLAAWESSNEGDLDCDGVTDQADLGILLGRWGEVCP